MFMRDRIFQGKWARGEKRSAYTGKPTHGEATERREEEGEGGLGTGYEKSRPRPDWGKEGTVPTSNQTPLRKVHQRRMSPKAQSQGSRVIPGPGVCTRKV